MYGGQREHPSKEIEPLWGKKVFRRTRAQELESGGSKGNGGKVLPQGALEIEERR